MARAESVRRVGLIGDVHTEHRRLELAIEHLRGMGVDRLLCTGDLPDGPGAGIDVDRCAALLEVYDVLTVAGNHDRWIRDHEMRDLPDATDPDDIEPETGDFLDRLPQTIELDTPAGPALLCHGLGTDDMAMVQPFDHGYEIDNNRALQKVLAEGRVRYLLNGHSHRRMVRTVGELTIINAGTLYTGQQPCSLLVDFAAREVHVFDLDGPPSRCSVEPLA